MESSIFLQKFLLLTEFARQSIVKITKCWYLHDPLPATTLVTIDYKFQNLLRLREAQQLQKSY